MADNREPSELPTNPPLKVDQVRSMPGGALLRTIPQGRYMIPASVQSSTAIISNTSSLQTQVLPKVTGPGGVTGVSRISTVPLQAQATPATGYHVPRGAAAVANISVPRSSVATPIVRGPATLQTIGVTQQHTLPTSGPATGRPLVGVACLPGQTRPPPIPVGARLVSSPMRPLGDAAARPLLLHKQVTLTQQQVQSTFQMSGSGGGVGGGGGTAVRSYSNVSRHPSNAPSLSRITATLPPGMVQLPAAVFLPTQNLKAQPKVISQSHGTSVQLPSATSSIPQTLSISTVVSRPVVLGGGGSGAGVQQVAGGGGGSRPSLKPTLGLPSSASSQSGQTASEPPVSSSAGPQQQQPQVTAVPSQQQVYLPAGAGRSTILVREPARSTQSTAPPESISISVSTTSSSSSAPSGGLSTFYTLPASAAASYLAEATAGGGVSGTSVRPLVSLPPAAASPRVSSAQPLTQQQSIQGELSGASTGGQQPLRLNPVMVVEPPRIQTLLPVAASPDNPPHLGVSEMVSSGTSSTLGGVNASLSGLTLTKQITSPRPSILRKREPDGSPLKTGGKSLPALVTTRCSSPPQLPPSPPPGSKRTGGPPESASSGGSTTVSAQSSPGESPPGGTTGLKEEEEGPPPAPLQTPLPQLRVQPPTEVSPRKKPRKQQLTGNQLSEPAFSDDEMEFISEEKIKKEAKEALEMETKVVPKRKTMSLLSSYKNLWKPRNNHFMRYTDVRPREEKTPSLVDIANQKHALQKINGWKIYHLGSQIEDVVNSEDEFIDFYNSLLGVLEVNQKKNKNKDIDKEYSRINERVRANFQRTKVAKDQMLDAKTQIMKFVDHKNYVHDLLSKNVSKRNTTKKRDRL